MSVQKNFAQPDGFQFGFFDNARKQKLRFGHVKTNADKPKGTLVIGPGYGETIEKYFELVNELKAEGYNLYIIEWMGQGKSDRWDKFDSQKPYDPKDFLLHHRDDLYKFVTEVVKLDDGQKLGYLGMSMGGHIGAQFAHHYNYIFDAMSLNAAFFDMNTRGYPKALTSSLLTSKKWIGHGNKYVPGGGPWNKLKKAFNENSKTSDRARYEHLLRIKEKDKALQLGDVTIDWVRHARPAINYLKSKRTLKEIITPIQLIVPGNDATVCVKAQDRAARFLENAIYAKFPYAKHEIWMERDEIRNIWKDRVFKFLKENFEADMPPVRIGRRVPIQKNRTINR